MAAHTDPITGAIENIGGLSVYISTNDILKFIEENEPTCISGISEQFNVSWATAKTLLLELVLHGKINMKKCGKTWIVWIKKSQ